MTSQGKADPLEMGYEEWTVKTGFQAMVSAGLTDKLS